MSAPEGARGAAPRAAWVVVPALNEAERIEACLAALQEAASRAPGPVAVVVVDDGSTDATAELARAALEAWDAGDHTVLSGPAAGVGWARRTGIEHALAACAPGAIIATTDADSRVASDWLAILHDRIEAGHPVVAGDVHLDPGTDLQLVRARAVRLARRVAALPQPEAGAPHPHFAGSNLAFVAHALRALGPLPVPRALEDEAILERCRALGIPVLRDAGPIVVTSARLDGRAPGGLAAALTADASALPDGPPPGPSGRAAAVRAPSVVC